MKSYNINAIKRPSKQAIAKVASISGGRDILYSYVATENDHTVVGNVNISCWQGDNYHQKLNLNLVTKTILRI